MASSGGREQQRPAAKRMLLLSRVAQGKPTGQLCPGKAGGHAGESPPAFSSPAQCKEPRGFLWLAAQKGAMGLASHLAVSRSPAQ